MEFWRRGARLPDDREDRSPRAGCRSGDPRRERAGHHGALPSHALGCPPRLVRREPSPCKDHVNDSEGKNRNAERREAEEGKARYAMPLEFAVDDEVRRRSDERHHAAYEGGEAERHHEPPGCNAGTLRDTQRNGDEDRRHGRRTHGGSERAYNNHEQADEPDFTRPGPNNQPVAEHLGNAGSHQPVADHKESCNEHDAGIAETRQRLPPWSVRR
jgi:hypothetical protein